MALFRRLRAPEPLPPINGEGVMLRGPQMADYSAWAELREASRKFLTPWEPTWPSDDLTRPAFRQRLRRYAEDMRTDQAYPFFLFRTEDNALVGGLALANIRPGAAQAGSLGYWIGTPFIQRGYMTAAVRALVPAAFDVLRLHRVEAACIPTNLPSVRLLEKTSFPRGGYARSHLCIHRTMADQLVFPRPDKEPPSLDREPV